MRCYDEPIDVRKGLVSGCEAPEHFRWRKRWWVVRALLGSWVETGAWWEHAGVGAILGSDGQPTAGSAVAELLDEREVWRVEAVRTRRSSAECSNGERSGVFELAFSWRDASWRLLCTLD